MTEPTIEITTKDLVPPRDKHQNLVLRSRRRASLYREVVREDIAAKKDLWDAASDIDILCVFIEKHFEQGKEDE